ncbi:zf-HC2 domain-containing protein [Tumebacillus permanentifrigoris]|uniref:Uncharacterized protein n=1 Tax=Tumebacillus permanentifrigoris TaxID=378543 RepID=A0A316DAX6_9BACL|nr:zf-HC2 domain-containing protein [Tumebacillus permanentifrigoris]PWK10312.1 hypothetical protein C7459_112134 [Tumebacillus permanentifrigoris]
MNCKDIQELLWCGEITPDVQLHLKTCVRCRAEQATLYELGIAAEGVEIPRPTRSLLPARAEMEAVIRNQQRRRYTKWLSVTAVAACLALAVTQVPGLLQPATQTSPPAGLQPNPTPPTPIASTKPVEQQIQEYLSEYHHTPHSDQIKQWALVEHVTIAATNENGIFEDKLSPFFQYVNVFAQQASLDLAPYRTRDDLSAYIVPLQAATDQEAVFLVAGGSQVIGAWQRLANTGELLSLDNKHFGEITHVPWAEWVQTQKLENITPEMRTRTPEELLVQYADASAREDVQSMSGMISQWYLVNLNLAGVERNQLFPTSNPSFGLPVQRGLQTSDVQVKATALPAPDVSPASKAHNRVPAEAKVYQVTVPGGTRFVTVVRETKDAPWQIDQFSTGP